MFDMTPELENYLINYYLVVQKQKRVRKLDIDELLHKTLVNFTYGARLVDWPKVSYANYMNVLLGLLNRINETQVNHLSLNLWDIEQLWTIESKGTLAEKEKIANFFQLLFNTSQIRKVTFYGEGGSPENLICRQIAPYVAKSTTLEALTIDGNDVNKNDLHVLNKALIENTSCISLNLSFNGLNNDSMPLIIELISKKSLIKLNLQNNDFTDLAIRQLFVSLMNNNSLEILNIGDEDNDKLYNAVVTGETYNAYLALKDKNPKLKVEINNQFNLVKNLDKKRKKNELDTSSENEEDNHNANSKLKGKQETELPKDTSHKKIKTFQVTPEFSSLLSSSGNSSQTSVIQVSLFKNIVVPESSAEKEPTIKTEALAPSSPRN